MIPSHIFATLSLSSLITAIAFLPSSNLSGNLSAIAQIPIPQETNQVTKPNPPISPISAEKRSLIKELLEITDASNNAQQIMTAMVRSELPKLLSAILEKFPALNSDRPEVQKQLSEIASRIAIKYRDRVIKQVDANQLIEEISYPIYDKYFTESELRNIVNFYKSSTGKKAIRLMPQIVNDSMSRTNEILSPKLSSIMAEIIAEELAVVTPRK
jgi:hypothetical protein